MIYVFIAIFMALVFGLCFLVDKLWQRFVKNADFDQSKVRLARSNIVFGTLLAVFGLVLLLFVAPEQGGIWWFMTAVILLVGLFLLANYCLTGIDYNEMGFTYRRLGHRLQSFSYDQICGQRTFANRAGINVLLYAGDEEIYLYASMKGTQAFLSTAFNGWCAAHGIDPEQVSPPNPENMIWFNEPVEQET